MRKIEVTNSDDAILYLADCMLATVSDLASKKSKSKGDYRRHIDIAQTTVDWIVSFNLNIEVNSRIYAVVSLPHRSVLEWAKKYEV